MGEKGIRFQEIVLSNDLAFCIEALADVRRLERAGLLPRFAVALKRLEHQVAGDNLPGGRLSPHKIYIASAAADC